MQSSIADGGTTSDDDLHGRRLNLIAERGDVDTSEGPVENDRRGEAVRHAPESLSDLDRELVTLTTWERLIRK